MQDDSDTSGHMRGEEAELTWIGCSAGEEVGRGQGCEEWRDGGGRGHTVEEWSGVKEWINGGGRFHIEKQERN